jgi:hypothetical protein
MDNTPSRGVLLVFFIWSCSIHNNAIMMWGRSFSVARRRTFSSSSLEQHYPWGRQRREASSSSSSIIGLAVGRGGNDRGFCSSSTPPFSGVSRRRTTLASRSSSSSHNVQPRADYLFAGDDDQTIVTYITDIEGDKAYLDRYVQLSKVLTFISTPTEGKVTSPRSPIVFPYAKCIEFTDPRAMLVFGGDIWDKGGHDLYTIRQLLHLKQRHPDRVVFILGNRDVNKLRILQEIGIHEVCMPHHPGLLWFQGTGKMGDPSSSSTLPPSNSAERLQWMLANTMGSPDAFEHRRGELQWERSEFQSTDAADTSSSSTVTDQEVVDSYRSSCHPKGELGQFLLQALLICRLGPLLFVHGSLPLISEHVEEVQNERAGSSTSSRASSVWDDLTFCMPWLPPGETAQDHGVSTIDQWMVALNGFCHDKVQEWKMDIARIEALGGVDDAEEPIWVREAGYQYGPSYSDLIQYGMGMLPNRKKNPTVIYNTFTPSGMPERFFTDSKEPHMVQATKTFFDRAAVQVILAGHKPQGDMPSPIRVDDSAWVVLADTSYSGETIWHHHEDDDNDGEYDDSRNEMVGAPRRTNLGRGHSVSFRGDVAVSEILIHLKGETLESVAYHGVLSDGSEYETVNLLTHGKNTTIGQVAPEHSVPSELDSPHQGRWWTKSILSDGSHLYHAGEGFRIWNFAGKPPPKSKSNR